MSDKQNDNHKRSEYLENNDDIFEDLIKHNAINCVFFDNMKISGGEILKRWEETRSIEK